MQEHAVPGVEPAVGVEDLGGLLLVVAVHEAVAPHPQLAFLAVGHVEPGFGIDDAVPDRRDVADRLAHAPVRGDAGHRAADEREVGGSDGEPGDVGQRAAARTTGGRASLGGSSASP